MSTKRALAWLSVWVGVAVLFGLGLFFFVDKQKALEFFGGYVLEESLSIDNLFLFILVFSGFGIEPKYQRRVLNYGIIGAIIFRLIFVLLGVAIIDRFHWVLYVFGGILILSGARMMMKKEDTASVTDSKIIKLFRRFFPVTDGLRGEKFIVRENGRRMATPLLAILVLIEFTDIIFAVDSIPAVFSITTDPLIVYSSNILAILGLRSLYFLLGNLHEKFHLVKYGVALVLVYTGLKLVLLMFHIEVPIGLSLGIIFAVIGASIGLSLLFAPKHKPAEKLTGQPAEKPLPEPE